MPLQLTGLASPATGLALEGAEPCQLAACTKQHYSHAGLHQTRMMIGSTQSGASLSRSCNELELLVLRCALELELHQSLSFTGSVAVLLLLYQQS